MKINRISIIVIGFFLQVGSIKSQVIFDTLFGKINDARTSLAVNRSTILLRSALDSSIVTFKISDTQGLFSILLNKNRKEDTYLEIKHIAYFTKIVNLDTLEEYSFQIYLEPREYAIEEIIIKGRQPIKARGDTLTYHVSEYIDSSEVSVGDLLAKLPGIEVNDRGDVMVHGKGIQKLLIDGEDLTDRNYQVLSNNLKADLVEKVEVYFNHIENQLLADFFRSDNIAINLIIKNEKKRKINASGMAGIGTDSRFDVETNIVALYDKFRGISILQSSNIGKPMQYIADLEAYSGDFKEDFLFGRSIDQLTDYSISYKKKDIRRINNVQFVSNRIAFKPGKSLNLVLSADLPQESLQYNLSNSYIFNQSSIGNYTDFIESKILLNQSKFQLSGVSSFNHKSRTRFVASYGDFSEENNYQILERESNSNKILSRGLFTYLDYTYKWNTNIVSILSVDFSDVNQMNQLEFKSPIANQIFSFENEFIPPSQIRSFESQSTVLGLKTLIKTSQQPLYIALSYLNRNNLYNQQDVFEDSSSLFFKPIFQNEIRLDLNYTHIFKKGHLMFLLQPGSVFLKLLEKTNSKEIVSFLNRKNYFQFGLEFKQNPQNGYSSIYRYSYLSSAFDVFRYLDVNFLRARYSIRRGNEDLIINAGHNLSFSLKKNLNYPYFLLFSDVQVRLNQRQDVEKYFFDNNFILSTWERQRQNEINLQINAGVEKLLDELAITVKAKPNFSYNRYLNFFNNQKRINHDFNYGVNTSLKSGWDIPVNFSLGQELNVFSTQIDQATVQTKLTALNSLSYLDLRIDIAKNFRIKISNSFNFYMDRDNNNFKFLITDLDADYTPGNNKVKFNISINNLFDVREIITLASSDFLQVVTNTVVLPQFFLLAVRFTL